jgi:two-component system LytT family response regulator
MILRAVVADDQPMARERLITLLADEPDVELAGTAASGTEAVERIRQLTPDVVFLDLQMPELDGFAVIEAIGVDRMPATVFVTAYDEYALRAFEVHALDYLLKPFGRERFRRALQRARHHVERERAGNLTARLAALLEQVKTPHPDGERVLVRSGGRVSFVTVAQIDWAEAQGNYVRVYAAGQTCLLRETLTSLHARLSAHGFVRVHRSCIVNLARISALELHRGGDYEVVLVDGQRLAMSRLYRDAVQSRLAGGA